MGKERSEDNELFEKRVFHDEVFRFCLGYIEETGLNTEPIARLEFMLERAASLTLTDLETKYVNGLNGNPSLVLVAFDGLIRELFRMLAEDDDREIMFRKTYLGLRKLIKKYNLEEFRYDLDNPPYRPLPRRLGEIWNEKEPSGTPIVYQDAYKLYSNLIRCLVNDLNSQEDAWSELRDYYSNLYLEKQNGSFVGLKDQYLSRPITFLSYSSDDRPYALHLFKTFINQGGFLYAFSILGKPLKNGTLIKEALRPWLDVSSQFLFLRSNSSDFLGIRPWCSWEIGRADSSAKGSCFYSDVIGVQMTKSILLDDFHLFHGVSGGMIS